MALDLKEAGRKEWTCRTYLMALTAEALRHESLESTKIYTQVSSEHTRRIAELFGSPEEVK